MSVSILDALKEVVIALKNWSDQNKVQKVIGKDLSTNDYTTEDKNKVANMPNDLVILNDKLYLAHNGYIINNSVVTLPGGGSGGSSVSEISTTIFIPYTNWIEISPNELYNQYIIINDITENTKVELNPTAAQVASLQSTETTLTVENDGTGMIKVWAIGNKPTSDYSMKVCLREVAFV